jgi:putative endonuclease
MPRASGHFAFNEGRNSLIERTIFGIQITLSPLKGRHVKKCLVFRVDYVSVIIVSSNCTKRKKHCVVNQPISGMKPTGRSTPKYLYFIAWVYIMTDSTHSALYVGFTRRIAIRMREHRTKRNPKSFTARYAVKKLVYYQGFLSITEAQRAELFIKGKTRAWKKALIEKKNPKWKDLTSELDNDRFRRVR